MYGHGRPTDPSYPSPLLPDICRVGRGDTGDIYLHLLRYLTRIHMRTRILWPFAICHCSRIWNASGWGGVYFWRMKPSLPPAKLQSAMVIRILGLGSTTVRKDSGSIWSNTKTRVRKRLTSLVILNDPLLINEKWKWKWIIATTVALS